MRISTPLLLSYALSTSASPAVHRRQQVDTAAYNAVPHVADAAAPVGDVSVAPISYDPTSIAEAAAAAATAAATDSAVVITASQATANPVPTSSSDACNPRTSGAGTSVQPDTTDAFVAFPQFLSDASNAQVPVGYTRILTASNLVAQDSTYMSSTLLSSYDTAGCAALCQSNQGCNSFNIYYERGSSLIPGPDCPNPSSTTYIKCAMFGAILTTNSAKGSSLSQYQFQTVYAGSSIFVVTAPAAVTGFNGPYSYGNASINAPSGYLGVQVFPQTQPYDPSVCAAACNQKSAFDISMGLPSKQNPDICNFFVAYVMYKNEQNGVFTCTYYNSAWDSSYATNVGQYDQAGNHYTIGSSYGYALPTAPQNGKGTTFALQIIGTGDSNDGTYLYQNSGGTLGVGRSTPYQFTLGGTGQLLGDATGSMGPASITSRYGTYGLNVFFGKNFQALTCSKSDTLSCTVGQRNIFEYCAVSKSLGIANVIDGGCVQVTLNVVS